MQTLGLSSEPKRSDGPLKSLFWPTVENAWDVDYLGRQGMWVCTIVAFFTAAFALFQPNILSVAIAILAALTYLLGGMGVRQASSLAASLVFAVYMLGFAYDVLMLQFPNIFRICFALILASNARAAFLASEWKPAAEGEDRPMRFNETLTDKFADQMPQKLWPYLQIPFLVLAIVMLLLELLGVGMLVVQRLGLMPHQ